MNEIPANTVDTGLADVPVCSSDISFTTTEPDGNPILLYRGYSIYDLVQGSFEESAYLILHNQLPNKAELDDFCRLLHDNMAINRQVQDHIQSYPKSTHLMDLTLTAFSYARMWDKDYANDSWRKISGDVAPRSRLLLDAGLRMGAKLPVICCNGYRHLSGKDPIPPDSKLSYAGNILHMLGIEPTEETTVALNKTLILYLDHTINCSTFTALVTESAGVDPYGPFIAASVALKGVLHGGANDLAGIMLDEVTDPRKAREYILARLKNREVIFGFGHRLAHYKGSVESRVRIVESLMKPIALRRNRGDLLEVYEEIKEIMLAEKGRAPNLDFPVALLYRVLGLPPEINTPIFQISRHFGWIANMRRQRDANGPLYRPTQRYTGPRLDERRQYIPLNERP